LLKAENNVLIFTGSIVKMLFQVMKTDDAAVVTAHGLVEQLRVVWQRGIVRYKLHVFIFYHDGGRKCLSNIDTSLPDYMA
jgi:hypothetical protein